MEEYYRITLDDYACPGFVSWDKSYFGTLEDIRALVEALEASGDHGMPMAELISAFRAYEAGEKHITHHVAYQEVPLLEPVKLLGKEMVQSGSYAWVHFNTWGCPYHMRCDGVETEHLWLEGSGKYYRVVKARFRNLQYQGLAGQWRPMTDGFWGFPEMLVFEDGYLYNRLAVVEKSSSLQELVEEDMSTFPSERDVDFTGFSQEIFGDG